MDVMLYARVKHISLDVAPIDIDCAMVGPAVGTIEASNAAGFPVGTRVSGYWGWEQRAVTGTARLRALDFGCQQPSYGVSVYGASGFTAYVALAVLAPVAAGETVVVGTAVGGLGHIAGQIAKLKGGRVIGIAGGAEKCRIAVEQLGFDACIDHKAKDFDAQLKSACPDGVDIDIETIGARALSAVMPLINNCARVIACGLMDTPMLGDRPFEGHYANTQNLLYALINRRVSVHGLVATDHLRKHLGAFHRAMHGWIDTGQVKPMEDVVDGIERAPAAFHDVFMGRNRGKRLIRVLHD